MKTIKLSAAVRTLAEYADELSDEIVLVTERNKAVAALVPLRGIDRESIAGLYYLAGGLESAKLSCKINVVPFRI